MSQLLAENQHFRMHEELGTGPGFYYLWDNGEESRARRADELRTETLAPVALGRARRPQFHLGGTGAGFIVFAAFCAPHGRPALPC